MPPTIIKNDPLFLKIRENIHKFKEDIMKDANEKLKIWKEKNQKGGKKMKEIISKTKIKREKGFLYYTGTDKDGNLTICRTKMARGGKGKKKKGAKK